MRFIACLLVTCLLCCLKLQTVVGYTWVTTNQTYLSCLPSVVSYTKPDSSMLNLLQTPMAGQNQKWGDGYASSLVTIDQPISVSVSKSSGEVYFVDYGHSRLRRVNPTSKIVTTVATITGLFSVHVSDVNSDVLVATTTQILKVNPSTGQTTVVAGSESSKGDSADGTLAVNGLINYPKSILATSSGIYFTDSGNHKVKLIGTDGKLSTIAGNGKRGYSGDGGKATSASLNNPFGVYLLSNIPAANATFGWDLHLYESSGYVYVSDTSNNAIRKIKSSSNVVTTVKASLNNPKSLIVKSNGDIIFAEVSSHLIRKLVGTTLSTLAGTGKPGFADGASTSAQFNFPRAVAIHSTTSDIYVADLGNNRIRKILSTTGAVSTVLGTGVRGFADGASSTALLSHVVALHVTSAGDIYFIDMHRIRKLSSGVVTTLAGGNSTGFSGDDGLATSSLLNYPQSLVVTSGGDVIVADTGNNRIRLISNTDNKIRTIAGNGQRTNVVETIIAKFTPLTPRSLALTNNQTTVLVSDVFGNVKSLDLCSCPSGYSYQCSNPPVAPSPTPQTSRGERSPVCGLLDSLLTY